MHRRSEPGGNGLAVLTLLGVRLALVAGASGGHDEDQGEGEEACESGEAIHGCPGMEGACDGQYAPLSSSTASRKSPRYVTP